MNRPIRRPPPTRRYHGSRRSAAAEVTRAAILRAAKEEFEAHGWAATTMRSIAMNAGVSLKTVEALFATKPAVLEATLLAALGRDAADTFLTATDWNTYQPLTRRAGMGPADVQAWVMRYYRHMLLA